MWRPKEITNKTVKIISVSTVVILMLVYNIISTNTMYQYLLYLYFCVTYIFSAVIKNWFKFIVFGFLYSILLVSQDILFLKTKNLIFFQKPLQNLDSKKPLNNLDFYQKLSKKLIF